MDTLISAGMGAMGMAGLGALYFAWKKGLPALKAWWSKGKSDLTSLKVDIADAHTKLAQLRTELEAMKAGAPVPAAPPAA